MILLAHECRRTPGSWARACHEDRGLLPLWADWWEERGDDRRAAAVRWLAGSGRWPRWAGARGFDWCNEEAYPAWQPCDLPRLLFIDLARRHPDRVAYRTPEAAVLDLLRVWRQGRAGVAP